MWIYYLNKIITNSYLGQIKGMSNVLKQLDGKGIVDLGFWVNISEREISFFFCLQYGFI